MDVFKNKSVVLFDGVCNLCNTSVNFIIKHDSQNYFLFASLQSDAAKEILLQFNLKNLDLKSILLIENNQIFDQSTAALRIAKKLNFAYNLLYVFIIVPKPLRNFIYGIIAKNRYKWFGKKESCMIPTKELKDKFI
ncbi:MAG: thiol-disulfide oxidoreductase DCC family protein [Lutibacter sp.]